MDDIKTQDLFLQIRTAHRMVVAYYKRLLPIIYQVATELDTQFYIWEPSNFARPAGLSTNIFDRWEWDLVPGLCTNYLFYKSEDSHKQKIGDWLLDFHVITDTGVIETSKKRNPDPLSLEKNVEDSNSVLRIYIYVPKKDNTLNWYSGIWKNSDCPKLSESPNKIVVDEENEILANGFEIQLSELVEKGSTELLVERIKKYRDVLLTS